MVSEPHTSLAQTWVRQDPEIEALKAWTLSGELEVLSEIAVDQPRPSYGTNIFTYPTAAPRPGQASFRM